MRAHTKVKHEMGKRFAIVIGVAAVGVMALGAQTVMAQTAAEAPDVVEYNTALTISHRSPGTWNIIHGGVLSPATVIREYDPAKAVSECMDGREVTVFKQRPGADLMLATAQSQLGSPPSAPEYGRGDWAIPPAVGKRPAANHARVYAKVTPKVGDGFVCLGARSRTICLWPAGKRSCRKVAGRRSETGG